MVIGFVGVIKTRSYECKLGVDHGYDIVRINLECEIDMLVSENCLIFSLVCWKNVLNKQAGDQSDLCNREAVILHQNILP